MGLTATLGPTKKTKLDIQFKAYDENGSLKAYLLTNMTVDTNRDDNFKGAEGTYVPITFKSTKDSVLTPSGVQVE